METAKLGSQGLQTSRIGLGCMGMSDFYGIRNDEESTRVIHRALDLGVTFFDTADMYGPFTNEILLGKALKGKREGITIATKFGFVRDPADPLVRRLNGRPEYAKSACDDSLKRLGIDEIDLYFLHRLDPEVPIEETVGAMGDLVKAGKIKTIGLSEVGAANLRKAHNTFPITALQTEYSLWSRDPEKELFDVCRSLNIGFVPYSPLGRGLLSGTIRKFEDLDENDQRRTWPRFQKESFQKNIDIIDKLGEFAKEKGCTTSQLALAWVLAQGDFIFPIPGTKKLKYLEENVGAVDIHFTKEELKEIEEISPSDSIAGTRYPDRMMKMLDR